jgi:hypothetical protein
LHGEIAPLANELVIFSVASNPEPVNSAIHRQAECPVMQTDTHAIHPSAAKRLELERRV